MTVQNILTVDVEDWFHICGVKDYIPEERWTSFESRVEVNIFRILDVLDQKEAKATFFSLGFIAERHPELILKIQQAGHEVATHGHAHRRVYTMTPDEFRKDLRTSIKILSGITGEPVKGFRAPEWSIRDDSLWALDIILEEGLVYDSSMASLLIIGSQAYSRIPFRHSLIGGGLWEFPPLVAGGPLVNLPVAGGWGLRVFPYAVIRQAIRNLNSKGYPALVYVHPREFDPAPPFIEIPLIKRFVLGAGIVDTGKRLGRLLDEFEFTSIAGFLEAECAERKAHSA